jgi:hypothetical protein
MWNANLPGCCREDVPVETCARIAPELWHACRRLPELLVDFYAQCIEIKDRNEFRGQGAALCRTSTG